MKSTLFFLLIFTFIFNSIAQIPPLKWVKSIGGLGQEVAYSMALDAAGNVYCTGYFNDTVDFDPGLGTYTLASAGLQDIFISKLDGNGNFVWAKNIGGTLDDLGSSIAVDASGNLSIAGCFKGTADFDPGVGVFNLTSISNSTDIFILKLSSVGNFMWAGAMGDASNNDVPSSLKFDSSGNICVTGYFSSTVDFDLGAGTFYISSINNTPDIFLLKLDPTGNFIWAKSIAGTNTDISAALSLDISDNIYITGHFFGQCDFDPGPGIFNLNCNVGYSDIFVSKLDVSGNFIWAKQMGGASFDYGKSITIDATGNVYTTGLFFSNGDFDPGIGIYNLTTSASGGAFFSKLDATGNFVWAKSLSTYSDGQVIRVSGSNNVYIGGTFNFTADFDLGPGTHTVTSLGANDAFVLNLDFSGNFISVSTIDGTDGESIKDIQLDSFGNIFCFGEYGNTPDFDPGPGIFNITSQGGADLFILKLSNDPSGLKKETMDEFFINIFPNPTNRKLTIEAAELNKIIITNYLSQTVLTLNNPNSKQEIDLSSFSDGIYFVTLRLESGVSKTYKQIVVH